MSALFDLFKILNVPQKKIIVNKEPLIFFINDFLNYEECTYLRFLAKDKLSQSQIGKGITNVIRTGSSCFINKKSEDILMLIEKKITSLFPNEDLDIIESFNIIKYKLHQTYAYHTDTHNVNNDGIAVDHKGKTIRQRKYTTICYLNEVNKGGDTRFELLNINIKPIMGRLLVFKNVLQDSNKLDRRSLHGGLPVIKGEKWIMTSWL